MVTKLKLSLSAIFIFFSTSFLLAQFDTVHVIQIQGRLVEQLEGKLKGVPNTTLNVVGVGEVKTNGKGDFSFKFPFLELNRFESQVEIKLNVPDYDILRPLDGGLLVDTLDYDMMLEVLVIGKNADAVYRKQVEKLNKRLIKLQGENSLSVRRLNAMNDSLLSNIQQSEVQRVKLENTISDLEANLEAAASGNDELKAQLVAAQQALEEQQAQLEAKQNELDLALAEKLRRQQQFYRAISADLKDFLIRTKDVHQMIHDVGEYFPSSNNPGFVTTFNNTLNAYNAILAKINEEHENYVLGVRQYWGNPILAHQVEQTFEVLFHQLHYPKLQPAISEIVGYIRIDKKKKAMKAGHETFHDLNALIINLEKMIDKTLAALEAVE